MSKSRPEGVSIVDCIRELPSCLCYLCNKDQDLKMPVYWENDPANHDWEQRAFLLVHVVEG